MESLAFLAVALPLLGIGVVVLFIVGIIQEGKSERKGGFKLAFFTVVSMVMLGFFVGSSVALLNLGLKQFAFTSATKYQQRYNTPPPLYVGTGVSAEGIKGDVARPIPAGGSDTPKEYACTESCEFTETDKANLETWVQSYQQWQQENTTSLPLRRELASILAFLIVSAPLYFVFSRLMNKGAAVELVEHKRATPLRSLYFYFVAFSGLIMAVIGLGGIINVALKVGLKTQPQTFSEPVPALTENSGVTSIVACKDKCGFTAEQVGLADQWLIDARAQRDRQRSNDGQYDNELATEIPVLLIGFPLFWYHFSRIRKETQEKETPPATLA